MRYHLTFVFIYTEGKKPCLQLYAKKETLIHSCRKIGGNFKGPIWIGYMQDKSPSCCIITLAQNQCVLISIH